MRRSPVLRLLVLVVTVTMLAAACGGGGGDGDGGRAGDVLPGGDGGRAGAEPAPAPEGDSAGSASQGDEAAEEATSITYEDTIDLTVQDLEEFWTEELPDVYGLEYESPTAVVPYDSTNTEDLAARFECFEGATYEDVAGNAFYCSLDDIVAYDDEELFPRFFEELGPFAVAFALAHEWGHAIQSPVRTATDGPSVLIETQADCFAGAWAAHIDSGDSDLLTLDPGDLEIGMAALLQVRDPVGSDPTTEGAHGNGFDRTNAFQLGFEGGVDRCEEYATNPPPITETPFSSVTDVVLGGDLPLSQVPDTMSADLDLYWAQFEELQPYQSIDEIIEYNIAIERQLPECPSLDLDPSHSGDYENLVFYCPDDDFIAFDEDLAEVVHRDLGDFGVAVLLSNAWSRGMQVRLEIDDEPEALALQADCFSGAWTGSIPADQSLTVATNGGPVERESAIILSPGDLDEAVQAFLLFSDDPAIEEGATGTAFERLTAFRTGFFEGEGACIDLAG